MKKLLSHKLEGVRFSDLNKSNDKNHITTVKLDGKKIGVIKSIEDGFAYFPINSKTHGGIFKTFREVAYDVVGDQNCLLIY